MGSRGTEGRPGMISRPSVQTYMCAVGPTLFTQAVPTGRSAPGSPPRPLPTPYPQEAPPLESPSQPPTSSPLPASCPVHVPRTPVPATLGPTLPAPWAMCQRDGKLFQEAGELAFLVVLLFACPQPQAGWEAQLPRFGAQGHEGSVRVSGWGGRQHLLSRDVMTQA